MHTVDSIFTKYGYIIKINVDRTRAPRYCFEIYKYTHFGNYEKIEVREWYLYQTWKAAFNDAIIELKYLKVIK
jgi:hypothetical protein